jgi:hypothetical protein
MDVITGSISTYVFTMPYGRPAFLLLYRAHLPTPTRSRTRHDR